ncbi:hypothetical protein BDV06DRAFT_221651 [Aspergillus oleicola]
MKMLYSRLSPLALCLLPELLAASSINHVRRDDCAGFATASNPGDTCESFAEQWRISVERLKELNPSVDCDDFDDYGFYCINEGLDDEDYNQTSSPSASSDVTSTTTSTSTMATPTTSAEDGTTSTTDATSTSTSTSETETATDAASTTDTDADATPTSDDADTTPTGGAHLQAAPGLVGAAASSLICTTQITSLHASLITSLNKPTTSKTLLQPSLLLSQKLMRNLAFMDGDKRDNLLAADVVLRGEGWFLSNVPRDIQDRRLGSLMLSLGS